MGKKHYISQGTINDVRITYRTRVRLLPFAGNYTHDKQYYKTQCRCGSEREEEQHIISGQCPVYKDIREKYGDLSSDSELVSYFSSVLSRRDEWDELQKDSGEE